jgi:hypothetical protein
MLLTSFTYKQLYVIIPTFLYLVTRSTRKDVSAANNPPVNDTYEYIEGATSNQIKKGRNNNIQLLICKTCK